MILSVRVVKGIASLLLLLCPADLRVRCIILLLHSWRLSTCARVSARRDWAFCPQVENGASRDFATVALLGFGQQRFALDGRVAHLVYELGLGWRGSSLTGAVVRTLRDMTLSHVQSKGASARAELTLLS